MYLVALMMVMEKIPMSTTPITETMVISMMGVFIIRNSSICMENPMLKMMPSRIPSIMATMSRMMIYRNTIMRIFLALSPIALSILYISASSRHLLKVYRKMNMVTNALIMHVISTTYAFRYFCSR